MVSRPIDENLRCRGACKHHEKMFDAAIKDYDRALSCIPDKYVAAKASHPFLPNFMSESKEQKSTFQKARVVIPPDENCKRCRNMRAFVALTRFSSCARICFCRGCVCALVFVVLAHLHPSVGFSRRTGNILVAVLYKKHVRLFLRSCICPFLCLSFLLSLPPCPRSVSLCECTGGA